MRPDTSPCETMPRIMERHKPERGIFVKLPSAQVIDLLAATGLDFVVVDLEHSQLSETDAIRLLEHADVLGFQALVRVPEVDRGAINRLLEAGAKGIQLSTVRNSGQLRRLRDAMFYAPGGTRSISLAHRRAGFGQHALGTYLANQSEHRPRIVAQIETGDTDEPLAHILNERPDVLFVGTTDLAVDLGLDDERVRARIEQLISAAEAANVPLGGFCLNDPRVVYDVVSSDLALLGRAARALVQPDE